MRPPFTPPLSSALALVTALTLAGPSGLLHAQRPRAATKFFSDDPLKRVADTQDASKAQPREISLTYDASINLFGRPGLNEVGRAESVNTIDEVPDSAWYTNRTALVPEDI